MHAFPISTHSHLRFFFRSSAKFLPPPTKTTKSPNLFSSITQTLIYPSKHHQHLIFTSKSAPDSSDFDLNHTDNDPNNDDDTGSSISSISQDVNTEIEKIGKNSRRICSRIAIDASLETVWGLLTDYERLADFIPGLAVSQLLEKGENFARIFQIGQQNLAFGLKFDAKGIVDCFEKDLERLPFGRKRDIEFKMVEGDFQVFEGKWSIVENYSEKCEDNETRDMDEEFETTLSYIVDVKPKLWLPVRLVEGRLCREIQLNLQCIREEAMKVAPNSIPTC